MTDRFEIDRTIAEGIGTYHLETIPQVETGKLELIEKAAIERAIADREDLIQRYQIDTLEIRSERNALASRLSAVESERDDLRARVEELRVQRPSMEPRAVFESLGSAFDRAEEELQGSRYRIDDVDVTLKANVLGTDEGVRMHLPSVDERSASANLSEVSFRLRAPQREAERDDEGEYVEIPDVTGVAHGTAARRLAAAGVDVGDVETVAADAGPNTVLEQFPEPFTVAPPGAPVDLVLAAEPPAEEASDDGAPGENGLEEGDPDVGNDPEGDGSDPEQEAGTAHTETAAEGDRDVEAERAAEAEKTARLEAEREEQAREEAEEQARKEAEEQARKEAEEQARKEAEEQARREREAADPSVDEEFLEEFRSAIVRGEVDDRTALADLLREAGLDGIEALVDVDADTLARTLDVSADRAEPLHEKLVATHGTAELESIGGIGPTYAGRLREAGIRTVGELARRDPREIAEVTRASPSRAEGWIEEARSVMAGR